MRPQPFVFVLSTALVTIACSEEKDPPAGPAPTPSTSALECAIGDVAECASYDELTAEAPAREESLVWAKLGGDAMTTQANGETIGSVKLAVRADGRVERTPIIKSHIGTPPRGLVTSRLSTAAVAKVQATLAALGPDDHKSFLRAGGSREPYGIDWFVLPTGGGCYAHDAVDTCATAPVQAVHRVLNDLATAVAQKWLATSVGTAALGPSMKSAGAWPLGDVTSDGVVEVPVADADKVDVEGERLFRLPNNDFVQVNTIVRGDQTAKLDLRRLTSFVVTDEALVTELLASIGRFEASKGAWLGIPLGVDVYPALRNREVAIIPALGARPEQLFYLRTFGQLHLEDDGEIDLP